MTDERIPDIGAPPVKHRVARTHSLPFSLLVLVMLAVAHPAGAQSAGAQRVANADRWSAVSEAVGRTGRTQPDGTYTVGFPRGDLNVRVGGLKLAPVLGIASSATFSAPGDGAMMMGDILLTDEEVPNVISRLGAESIDVTALHTHLTRETPRLMFVHVEAHGNAVKIAQGLRRALSVLKLTPPIGVPPLPTDFDLSTVEAVMGQKGRVAGGGVVMNVPRREVVTMHGVKIPASMGVSSTLLFQPLGKGKIAIAGDLVLLAPEVNPVIRVLAQYGIEVTTIHSHMLTESPRLFFLHYWAVDDQAKVTRGLRAALDLINSTPRQAETR